MKIINSTSHFAIALACFSATAWGQQTIDTDEHLTSPVPHRYIHGILGDAEFQLALPDAWNGKLLIGTRPFSGDELTSLAYKTVGLVKGYAYALSDEGWNRFDILDNPEDQYYESRRRIVQLTGYAKQTVRRHYGEPASRTYATGSSNGGHHAKWMVEDYPSLYDGGLSGFGFNSQFEMWGSMATVLRNYDVIAPRLDDIIAARAADPNWDPATAPLSPPLTPAQLTALQNVYNIPATVSGLAYNAGRLPGSEFTWAANYNTLLGYLRDVVPVVDRTYDPNGDGQLSDDELKQWDPHLSRVQVQNDLRKLDLTGKLQRPVIIAHGTIDVTVSPGAAEGYKRLVESRLGAASAWEVLAVYYIPGMGHGGAQFNAWLNPALDALDLWVDYRQSGGSVGAPPPDLLGGYSRE